MAEVSSWMRPTVDELMENLQVKMVSVLTLHHAASNYVIQEDFSPSSLS